MEQQLGPVNWAPYNPIPLSGIVRLWSLEAFAHGAQTVAYFRWRQYPYGQEQMHSGILLPDGSESPCFKEINKVTKELKEKPIAEVSKSKVAVIFDYKSCMGWDIQPHGEGLNYFDAVFDTYKTLRRLGQSIDVISPEKTDFSNYSIIFAPGLIFMKDNIKILLSNFDGEVFLGPRTAARSDDMQLTLPLPPNLPNFSAKIVASESFRSNCPIPLEKGGNFRNYREILEGDAQVLEKTESGEPALIKDGNFTYICGLMYEIALTRVIKTALEMVGLEILEMPSGVRIRDTEDERFWFNYSNRQQSVNFVSLKPAEVFRESLKCD